MGYLAEVHCADFPIYLFVSETQKHSEFMFCLLILREKKKIGLLVSHSTWQRFSITPFAKTRGGLVVVLSW